MASEGRAVVTRSRSSGSSGAKGDVRGMVRRGGSPGAGMNDRVACADRRLSTQVPEWARVAIKAGEKGFTTVLR